MCLDVFTTVRTIETLKAPLLFKGEIFYREVSLQAYYHTFIIANGRDKPTDH